MEVMEEGNLMDRVPVLLQRDMQYYQVDISHLTKLLRMNATHMLLIRTGTSIRSARNHLPWCCWWKT